LCYDQEGVNQYREAALKHREVLRTAEQRMDAAIENGDKAEAEKALAEATASGESFRELRSKLKPTDLFVAKYNIQVHGPHEVSFVLPRGVSRYDMILEAHALVAERDKRDLVYRGDLKEWGNDARFTASCESPERIQIDGHVKGGDGKTREQQEKFLTTKGLEQAQLEDLAAAFVAHYVATGEPLFGWYKKDSSWCFVVRAVGGALNFVSDGLLVHGLGVDFSLSNVAVASRVRSPSAKAPADKPESKKLDSRFFGSLLPWFLDPAKRGRF
jgi:hypothetical protein